MTDHSATMDRLERIRPLKVMIWTLLFLGGVVMITPIIFMASTSFKVGQEVYELSLIPQKATLENYLCIREESKFMR